MIRPIEYLQNMCCWSELKNVGNAFKWMFLSCSVSNYIEAFLKLLQLAQIFWIHRGTQNFQLHIYAILVWTISQQKISFLLFKFWPNTKNYFAFLTMPLVFVHSHQWYALSFAIQIWIMRLGLNEKFPDYKESYETPTSFPEQLFFDFLRFFCAAYRECIC